MNVAGAELRHHLRDVADAVTVLSRLDSTHQMALRLLDQLDEEDQRLASCLLLALEQDGGRGRGGRAWSSPAGGLYLNWLRADVPREIAARLPLLAGAAAVRALEASGAPRLGLKWPNDVLLGDGKLAGLLSHARHGETTSVSVGLGVNLLVRPVLAEAPPRPPVALADHVAVRPFAPWAAAIAAAFVAALEDGFVHPDAAVALWHERLVHRPGDALRVLLSDGAALDGRFVGLTGDGHLRLDTPHGERVVASGEIMA